MENEHVLRARDGHFGGLSPRLLAARLRLKSFSVTLADHSSFQGVENALLNESPDDGSRVLPIGPDLQQVVEIGHVDWIKAALDLRICHGRSSLAVLQMDAKWSTNRLRLASNRPICHVTICHVT